MYCFKKEKKREFLGNMRQTDLCTQTGIAKGNLSNVLSGKRQVSKKYANYLTSMSNMNNRNAYDFEYFFEQTEKGGEENDKHNNQENHD